MYFECPYICVVLSFVCDVVCLFIEFIGLCCALSCYVIVFVVRVCCVCFVCGVLCCWLLFHWFGVRVCGVVVALLSFVFLWYGLNDFPACGCIMYAPSLRCSSLLCVMVVACL